MALFSQNHVGLTAKDAAVHLKLKHYYNTKDGKDEKKHITAFHKFLDKHNPKQIYTMRIKGGKVNAYLELTLDQVKTNLLLLRNEQGIFFSEDVEQSQAITDNKTFFAVVDAGKLECSADDVACMLLERTLQEHDLDYRKE